MGLLYTFSLGHASSLYELYLVTLRLAIALAVALSVLVSVDRLLHVLKFLQVLRLAPALNTVTGVVAIYELAGWSREGRCFQLALELQKAYCAGATQSLCNRHQARGLIQAQVPARGGCPLHWQQLPPDRRAAAHVQ